MRDEASECGEHSGLDSDEEGPEAVSAFELTAVLQTALLFVVVVQCFHLGEAFLRDAIDLGHRLWLGYRRRASLMRCRRCRSPRGLCDGCLDPGLLCLQLSALVLADRQDIGDGTKAAHGDLEEVHGRLLVVR